MGDRRFGAALVTGTSSGIGREVARRLARRGTQVVAAARREEELRALAREAESEGGRIHAQPLDVADVAAVRAAVARWDAETGGLDLDLANAGIARARPATELSAEDVDQAVCVNVLGAFATIHAALDTTAAVGVTTSGNGRCSREAS